MVKRLLIATVGVVSAIRLSCALPSQVSLKNRIVSSALINIRFLIV